MNLSDCITVTASDEDFADAMFSNSLAASIEQAHIAAIEAECQAIADMIGIDVNDVTTEMWYEFTK